MLPEEGAALLGVAGVAVLVDRGLQQHLVVRGAVRVVAARALHLALAQRHVAGAESWAFFCRWQLVHSIICGGRSSDAGTGSPAFGVRIWHWTAGDVAAVVGRAHPVLLPALVVAVHADRGRHRPSSGP